MHKLTISFCVPGMSFAGDETLRTASLGGSETAALCLARELARRGHQVGMFCNTPSPGNHEGVLYHPLTDWQRYVVSVPHDVTIAQRLPETLVAQTAAKLNYLWCHDLAMARGISRARGVAWNVDRFAVVSKFMEDQYAEVYDLPRKEIFTTRNGVDLHLFPDYRNRARRRAKRLVYAARPERGLDLLTSRIMPELLKRDPEIQLVIAGYNNPADHMKEFYAECGEYLARLGSAVADAGHLSKLDLYRLYGEVGVYVYPTPSPAFPTFREVSCISLMEAQASGLPVVSTKIGALPETLAPGAGTLVEERENLDQYVADFCDAVMRYVSDSDAWSDASVAGREAAKGMSWAAVAEEWEEDFERTIRDRNDSPHRLFYHFYRRNDIVAAGVVATMLDEAGDQHGAEIRARLDKEYQFLYSPEAFAEHYAVHGKLTDDRLQKSEPALLEKMFQESAEQRFALFVQWLESQPGIRRVLDYGCGHGWCDIYLHNKVGREWLGVDIDPNAVKWSRTFADRHAKNPKALEFRVGDHNIDLVDQTPFDAALISEVLEHCQDPKGVVEAIERWVRPGGQVLITVPYGPSEYGTWNWANFRNHIWDFEPADIWDLFGSKPELETFAVCEGPNPLTGEVRGFHLIRYKADQKPLGEINWERKLAWQAPRQTLSVALIAGGPLVEETAHWCLRSVQTVADEINVVDTGMTPEARRIVEQYPVRIIQGSDPLQHGFEVPRNEALDMCRMDWALWLDMDEKMLDPQCLPKYLRKNLYDGYSIRQHHFAVDTQFNPDMPVRLIRLWDRNDEQKVRFWGMIHEHPETGINKGPGQVIVLSDVQIAHVGYLAESGRRGRFWRNSPMLDRDIERYPDRLLQKHFICRDLTLLNMYELQQNGGRLTGEIRARAEEVKKLYRQHFLDKPALVAIDTLQYYTQALQILGEGIDVSFDFQAQRDGVGDQFNGHGTKARFASAEEAVKEISRRVSDKLRPYDNSWW